MARPRSREYAHLDEELFVKYEEGKKIKRGQPIGWVPSEHISWAKLLFNQGRTGGYPTGNWTDPDN